MAYSILDEINKANQTGSLGKQAISPVGNLKPQTNILPQAQIKPAVVSTTTPGATVTQVHGGSLTPPITPPTNPNQAQIGQLQGQLTNLQNQQSALKQYGLNDTNQLTKDASGAYIPTPPPEPTPGTINSATQQYNPYSVTTPGSVPNNGLYGQLITGAANMAAQQSPQYVAAQKQYLDLQNQIAALQQNQAQQTANIEGSPIDLSLATGQEGILNRLYASKQAALAGQLSGAQAAAQTATGQQATQLGGLESAAGLAQPQPANALGTFNPVTGQYSQYGGGQGGGAAVAGAVGTQIQQGAAVQTMKGQQSQAQALAKNLGSLIDSAGINPTNASALTAFANGVNQWINTQSGDPQYQNFANLINEISSRYASILNQAGGTPTDQSTISHSIINGLASGQDIKTVLGSLDKNADDSIDALRRTSQGNAATNQSGGNTFGSFF